MTSITCFSLFIRTKVCIQSQIFINLVTNNQIMYFHVSSYLNWLITPNAQHHSLKEKTSCRSRDPHLTRLKTAIPNNFLVIINNVLEKPTRTSVIMIHVQKGVINLKYSCLHIPVTVYISGLFRVFVIVIIISIPIGWNWIIKFRSSNFYNSEQCDIDIIILKAFVPHMSISKLEAMSIPVFIYLRQIRAQ